MPDTVSGKAPRCTLEEVCPSCGGMKMHHTDHAPGGFEVCGTCKGKGTVSSTTSTALITIEAMRTKLNAIFDHYVVEDLTLEQLAIIRRAIKAMLPEGQSYQVDTFKDPSDRDKVICRISVPNEDLEITFVTNGKDLFFK